MNVDGKCQAFPATLPAIQFTNTFDKKKDEKETCLNVVFQENKKN